MTAIALFFRQNGKLLLIFAGLAAIGYGGYLIASKSEKVTSLTASLGAARDSLFHYVAQTSRLQRDSTKLQNLYLLEKNARLTKENEAEQAKNEGYRAREELRYHDEQNYQTVMSLSASQKKAAADLAIANRKLGILLTTANDSSTNGQITTLSNMVADRDTTISRQAGTIGTLRAENGALRVENRSLKDEVSDLENELNGKNQSVATYIEAVPKGVLGIGYGKRIRKAANEIRAGRVR